MAAIQSGEEVSEADIEHIRSIMSLLEEMQLTGTGANFRANIVEALNASGWSTDVDSVVEDMDRVLNEAMEGVGADAAAGVGEGMSAADMSTYGETVAANTEAALRSGSAFNSASPANRTKPVGRDAALGVGVGMAETDLSSYASATASQVVSALQANLNASAMRSTGNLAMAGLAAGIIAGRSRVISAMRSAANVAVRAAKDTLDIHSPSRVFRDDVGAMAMQGFGEGILQETEAQAKIIRNASRYLTGEAKSGTIAASSTDNRRIYNNSVNSTVRVDQMVVRDEQDIRSLAIEIAALTRRQQRGRGLRMA